MGRWSPVPRHRSSPILTNCNKVDTVRPHSSILLLNLRSGVLSRSSWCVAGGPSEAIRVKKTTPTLPQKGRDHASSGHEVNQADLSACFFYTVVTQSVGRCAAMRNGHIAKDAPKKGKPRNGPDGRISTHRGAQESQHHPSEQCNAAFFSRNYGHSDRGKSGSRCLIGVCRRQSVVIAGTLSPCRFALRSRQFYVSAKASNAQPSVVSLTSISV